MNTDSNPDICPVCGEERWILTHPTDLREAELLTTDCPACIAYLEDEAERVYGD